MTEPGDTTPISDEAGEYVIDHGWLCEVHNEHTCGVAKNDPVHEPGCGLEPIARVEELLRALSAAPLLVSAEAERAHEIISDELLAKWRSASMAARKSEHHFPADCLAEAVGVVEGLRAELAERDAKLREAMRVSEWRVSAKDDEVFAIAVATLTQHWDCGDDL